MKLRTFLVRDAKNDLSKYISEDFKIYLLKENAKSVDVLRLVNNYYSEELYFNNYQLDKHSEKYYGHNSSKIAHRAKWKEVPLESANHKWSYSISVLYFLHNVHAACKSISIPEDADMRLSQYFKRHPATAALSRKVGVTEVDDSQQEERWRHVVE